MIQPHIAAAIFGTAILIEYQTGGRPYWQTLLVGGTVGAMVTLGWVLLSSLITP